MLPLIVGTLLAVLAVAYVLYPLLFSSASPTHRPVGLPRVAPVADEDAIVALREIEFDRATGKLSDTDYAELKSRYVTGLAWLDGDAEDREGGIADAEGGCAKQHPGRLGGAGNCEHRRGNGQRARKRCVIGWQRRELADEHRIELADTGKHSFH